MRQKISLFIAISLLTICSAFAMEKLQVTPAVYYGIQKYKQGNYAGCLQDMQQSLKVMKDTSLPLYYIGNSYVKLGRKDDAVASYNQVIELNTNPGLVGFSKQAVECLGDETKCGGADDISAFINSKKFMHADVVKKLEEQQVEQVMTEINASKGDKDDTIDFNKYKYLNDASNAMPTDEEIANAVKVLARVGYNPYANIQNGSHNMNNALMQQGSAGVDFQAMLPFLMANGQNAQGSEHSAQMIQAMMMSGMQAGF